jgi:hypothetical protein
MTAQDLLLAKHLITSAPRQIVALRTSRTDEDEESFRQGLIFGPLAVHTSVDPKRGWTVTHIRTRAAVKRDLSEEQAVLLAEKLKDAAWDFDDPKLAKRLSPVVSAAIQMVMK